MHQSRKHLGKGFPYLLRLLSLNCPHLGDRALSRGGRLLPGAAPVLDGFSHHGPRHPRHAARAPQGSAVRQGPRRFGPGAQPALVHPADLRLAAAVLAGQGDGDVLVWDGVAPREVLALRAALGEVLHAAVAGPAELEVFTVASAPGAGSAQVLEAGVHGGLRHRWGWVVEMVNGVLEGERLEAALLVQRRVQGPPHLGSALGRALRVPQLLDGGHRRDGELATGQPQRHIVQGRGMVAVGRVRVLQVHQRDATAIGQEVFPVVLIRVSHALGGGLLNQQQGLAPQISIYIFLGWRLQLMQVAVEWKGIWLIFKQLRP